MANPSALGSIEYEAESGWAEDVSTFATHRLPLVAPIDVSGLVHSKVAPDGVYQRRQEGSQYILMTQGGSFKTKLDLAGHGATTAGSPTVDAIETFLGLDFGNVGLSASASTTLTGGTAAAPTTTASATFPAGGLCRVGALGDADGDGQMYPITTHVTTTLTLAAALRATPANGAVLYPVVQLYPSSAPTSNAITGTRFRLQTANLQYTCHGCWPMSASISGLAPGGRPQIEVTWGVSRWGYSTGTFPSTVTSNRYNPAPVAAGSLHINSVGTSTRAEYYCRDFTLDYTLGVEMLKGPGGVGAYQDIIGATRTSDDVKVGFTVDADAATTSPVLPGWGTGTTAKSLMYTTSTAPGSAVGIWLPNVCVTSVPIQMADGNINRFRFEGSAYTTSTTTTALTLAAFILGLG